MKTNQKKTAPFCILLGAGRFNQVKTLSRKRAKTCLARYEQSFTANTWMPRPH
jgi:hypothetical protein